MADTKWRFLNIFSYLKQQYRTVEAKKKMIYYARKQPFFAVALISFIYETKMANGKWRLWGNFTKHCAINDHKQFMLFLKL